jgi:hypothetical protein
VLITAAHLRVDKAIDDNDNCMKERNAWGGPSIMVWGGIGLNVKLGPVIF